MPARLEPRLLPDRLTGVFAPDRWRKPLHLTLMRLARLFSLLAAILTAATLLAPAATAEPPFRLPDYVTDNAGALNDKQLSDVQKAVDQLYSDRHVRLWVVFVDSFAPKGAMSWAQDTSQISDFGSEDAILAVATDERSYAFLVPPAAAGGSSTKVDAIRRDKIEPALRGSDWAGAAIAAATGLAALGAAGRRDSRQHLLGAGADHRRDPAAGDRAADPVEQAPQAQAPRGRGGRGQTGGPHRSQRAGVGARRRARRPVPVDRRRRRQRGTHQQQRAGAGRRGVRPAADRAVRHGRRERQGHPQAGVQRPPAARRRGARNRRGTPRSADPGGGRRRPRQPRARHPDPGLPPTARPGDQRPRPARRADPAAGGRHRPHRPVAAEADPAAQRVRRLRAGLGGPQRQRRQGAAGLRRRGDQPRPRAGGQAHRRQAGRTDRLRARRGIGSAASQFDARRGGQRGQRHSQSGQHTAGGDHRHPERHQPGRHPAGPGRRWPTPPSSRRRATPR